ncbi:2777_t:CDS:2 [Diversispora eburnea]|uniref:2777_t:CDS:1 n=1 Tax=Diversispora eburnea TaxID=1213867 RepID=A0A9N9GCK5_9GLOM|nr:2777_t:CDS:2 [Diversispora eburnea]
MGLRNLHEINLIHYELHSENISMKNYLDLSDSNIEIDLSSLDNDVMRQLKIADENQKNTSKSQKQELLEFFSYSSKLHPQSYYIGRYIHTLHGLHDLLEEIKSGKSSDPNLLRQ